MRCNKCMSVFPIKKLAIAKGNCPFCGTLIPVADYCQHIPERRWWHLYSAAPLCVKIAIWLLIVTGVVVLTGVLMEVARNLHGGRGWMGLLEDAYGCFCLALVILPLIFALVRGRVPYISVIMFCVCELTLTSCLEDRLELGVLALAFLAPFVTPAARRWRIHIREVELSYAIALKSGADLSSLKGV